MRGQNIEKFMAEGLAEWHSFYQGRTTRRDNNLEELKRLQGKAGEKRMPYNGWQLWKRWYDRMRINRRANRLARRIEQLNFSTKGADREIANRATRTKERLFEAVLRASDVTALSKNREHQRNIEQPDQLRRMCRDLNAETPVVRRAAQNLQAALKPAPDIAPEDQATGLPTPPAKERVEDELRRLAVSLRSLSSTYISRSVEYPGSQRLGKLTAELIDLRLHNLTVDAEGTEVAQAAELLPRVFETLDKVDQLTSRIDAIVDDERSKAEQGHSDWMDEMIRSKATGDEQSKQVETLITSARS